MYLKIYILKRRWSKEVYYLLGFLVIVIISLLIALVVIASTGREGKIYLNSILQAWPNYSSRGPN